MSEMNTTITSASAPTEDAGPDGPCCGGATQWMSRDDATDTARRLAAIADPIRLQIVSIIANAPDGEVCACDFVLPLDRSQPTISHHLKVLAEAGIVAGDKRGRWIWYRLDAEAVADLVDGVRSTAYGRV